MGSECYGGWPQASYGIRIGRGLAVSRLACRAGIFLGRTRKRALALASFWRAAFGGCPLVYLIAATGVAQITNASPEIGCWGWTLGTVPDWDGPFFSGRRRASSGRLFARSSATTRFGWYGTRDSGRRGASFWFGCWWCRRSSTGEKLTTGQVAPAEVKSRGNYFSSPATVLTTQDNPLEGRMGWDGIEKRKRGTRPSNLQNGAPSACDCNHCSAVVNHTSGRKRPVRAAKLSVAAKKGKREKWKRGRPSLAPGFVLCCACAGAHCRVGCIPSPSG